LGVIRIVLENLLRARLLGLFGQQLSRHGVVFGAMDDPDDYRNEDLPIELENFIHDRLKNHLRSDGIRHDVIDAAIAMPGHDDLVLLVARVRALQAFLGTDDGENLVQGFKRANNILQAEEKKDGIEYSLDPDVKFADTDSERALFAALDGADAPIARALEAEDFAAAMGAMANLRGPIDAFFEDTQVNAENAIVRRNRLCLLHRIRTVMGKVARFEALEG